MTSSPSRTIAASRAAAASVVGLGALAAIIITLHAIRRDCDPRMRHLSEYAVGSSGTLMVVGFVVAGASLLALSAAFWWSVTPSIALRVACGLLALNGLINWGMAAFTTDLSIPGPGGAVEITPSGRIHDGLAAVHAVIWFVIPLLLVRAMRRDDRWLGVVRLATAAAIIEMAFVCVVVSMQPSLPGLGQRLWIGVLILWCALQAIMIGRVGGA